MKKLGFTISGLIALCSLCSLIGFTSSAAAAADSVHAWTGLWQMTSPGKPGGSIALSEDGGALTGVIAFNVNDRDTGQRIDIQTRTMVNPHLQGDVLVFQVRRFLRPHLRDAPPTPEGAPDPTDIVEMTATRSAEGRAILACAQCGSAIQMELVKQQ
jgi:hypothetical protein